MKSLLKHQHALGFWMVGLAIGFYTFEYFLRVVPSVFIDYYKINFAFTDTQISIFATAYFMAYTPLQLGVGAIADTFGVRRLLLFSILICLVGSFCTVAVLQLDADLVYLASCFGRFLIGFGSAFAFVAVLKTAREWLPNRYFPTVSGMTTSIGMLGAISAQTLLPLLIDHVGHETSLWLMTILGIFLYVITYREVYDNPTHFKAAEKNQVRELFSALMTVLRIPQIWIIGLIGSAMFMPTVIFSDLWAPKFFEDVDHIAHPVSGVLSSMLYWGWIAGAPVVGYISSYLDRRRVIIRISSLVAAIIIGAIIYFPTSNAILVGTMMFMLGLFCSAQILVFAVANDNVEEKYLATGIAVTNMLVMCSGFLQPYIGQLLENYAYNDQIFNAAGFRQALMIMPSSLLLSFLLTFLLKEKGQK